MPSWGLRAVSGRNALEGAGEELSPKQMLEQMRRKKLSVGWAEKFAATFAPKSSADDFKLNWVGNIDRHQRQLFWKLITLLCDRIDPYLTWMRLAHDIIQGAKARCAGAIHFVATSVVPALQVAAAACARQALLFAREVLILARMFLQQAGARVGKSALSLVGVGVALPPPPTPPAATHCVGPEPWWMRKLSEYAPFLAAKQATRSTRSNFKSDVFQSKFRSGTGGATSAPATIFQSRVETHPETHSLLFPSSNPSAYPRLSVRKGSDVPTRLDLVDGGGDRSGRGSEVGVVSRGGHAVQGALIKAEKESVVENKVKRLLDIVQSVDLLI